jgi:pyruvate kinase
MDKKTKIVCTIGPSTDAPGVLEAMLRAGMNVARFNFSHGSYEEHAARMQAVRDASKITQLCWILRDQKFGWDILRMGKYNWKPASPLP